MAVQDVIKFLCKSKKISISELARRIGQSRQNLSKKLERDTLTQAEMHRIAEALNMCFEQSFTDSSGRKYDTSRNIENLENKSAVLTRALIQYQEALAEKKISEKENIKKLLETYRIFLNVDLVFVFELSTDNSKVIYTNASFSDKKYDVEDTEISLSQTDFIRYKKLYEQQEICTYREISPLNKEFSSIIHYGAFRNGQLDGSVGMVDFHNERLWTDEEKGYLLHLGRTLHSHITSSRLNKLIKKWEIQISKEKANAKLLNKAIIDAENANRAKTTFLFNMSHDIRTPMNAIKGYTEMARHHIDEKERVLDYLEKIQMAEQNLLDLINEVLDMSRIESGKVVLEHEPVNLISMFKKMVTLTFPTANERGLQLNGKLTNLKNNLVYADGTRIYQIIMNVLGNSLKYTACGGYISFELSEEASPKPGFGRYIFTVKDTGIGMSKEFLKHIFEEFSREKSATVSGVEGSGLGMSIVKRLVDMMQGTIEIESELGRGTKTSIALDLEQRTAGEGESEESDEAVKIDLKGKRILLVDDNELNREIARTMLEEYGLKIDEADDGDIALQKVRNSKLHYYDFVLMDIQMPRMNGITATRAIRSLPNENAKIPIIAMSANAFAEDRKKSIEVGMNEHIAKPFEIVQVLKVLARCCKELEK